MATYHIAVAFFISCVSAAVVPQDSFHLSKYTEICPRDSPNINACILNSFKKIQPYLIKGIPELDLPPIDPFKLNETHMEYHNGQVHCKVGIRDYSLYGLRDLQVQKVRTDFDDLNNFNIDIDVFIPKVKSDGRYKLQGKFIKSEFSGKGIFNMTISNIKATWSFTGTKHVIDGVTFVKMNNLDMEPVVGDMKVYASNLFSGNEALSKTALKLFNQHWRLVYKEVLPYVKTSWDEIMTELANRVFLKVPFDEIFPPTSP